MPIGADGLSGTVSNAGGWSGGSLHSGQAERPNKPPVVRGKGRKDDLSQLTPKELRDRLWVQVDHNVKEWGPGKIGAMRADVLRELGRRAMQTEADVLKFSGSGGVQMQGNAPWASSSGSKGSKSPVSQKPANDNLKIQALFKKKWGRMNPQESQLFSDIDLVLEGSIPTADLATKPPKGVDPEVWHDVVHRGKHTDYGGARAHYNRTISKMKNATPAAPEKSPMTVAPGWRNRYEAHDDMYTDRVPTFSSRPRRFSSVDSEHLRAQRTGNWQDRNVGHKYRAETDADITFQSHYDNGWNLAGRKGHTVHYSHPAGHTAWTRPDGSWEILHNNGRTISHADNHDLGNVLDGLRTQTQESGEIVKHGGGDIVTRGGFLRRIAGNLAGSAVARTVATSAVPAVAQAVMKPAPDPKVVQHGIDHGHAVNFFKKMADAGGFGQFHNSSDVSHDPSTGSWNGGDTSTVYKHKSGKFVHFDDELAQDHNSAMNMSRGGRSGYDDHIDRARGANYRTYKVHVMDPKTGEVTQHSPQIDISRAPHFGDFEGTDADVAMHGWQKAQINKHLDSNLPEDIRDLMLDSESVLGESEWSDANPDLYARIGHRDTSVDIPYTDTPYRPLTLKQKGQVRCPHCGGTGPTYKGSCNACGGKIKESETYLTGGPVDKTRTGQIEIRIKEGATIDVRSPDRILDNVNAYLFFEQWQQLLPKSPLLQASTMYRISEWWKMHSEHGDLLSIDLTTGQGTVVNESTGKAYSIGHLGSIPDSFPDDVSALEVERL